MANVQMGVVDNKFARSTYFEIVSPKELKYVYLIMPAIDFGGVFKKNHINTRLVLASPLHGCSPPDNAHLIDESIVLVERGDCSFLSKTVMAETYGALAIIVMDNDASADAITFNMVGDETGREANIPAFFLAGKDGYRIQEVLSKQSSPVAIINIPINVTAVPEYLVQQPPWRLW